MVVRLLTLFLLLAAAVAGAAGPAVASDQGPFTPLPQAPPEQPPAPPPPPPPDEQDDGLSRSQELLIGGAGLVLLFGIGWAIVRDARSAAPVDRDHPLEEAARRKGSRTPPARRVSQGRAKAKAARRARKKNR